MNTHADKTPDSKSQTVVRNDYSAQSGSESSFQFADNRSEATAQRKLNELANNSQTLKQAAQLKSFADSYPGHTIQKVGIEEEEPLQGKFIPAQRQGIEEEELLQGKFEPVQMMEEEELLQGKFETIQKKASPEYSRRENKTGLPDNLKSGIENLSGYSLDDVKVNYNSNKPAQLNAHAYAQGTDIHVASGQEKHLPHEAWHVVQQKQGRVKPTMQMKGHVNVNDDEGLEREADVMGAKALQMKQEENTVRDVSKSVAQKKSNEKQGFGYFDNRSDAITQSRFYENANNNSSINLNLTGMNVISQRKLDHDKITEEGGIPKFEMGADIDCTQQLVVRGDGFGFGASTAQLGNHNEGIKQKGSAKAPKWPSGISAFESVNSTPKALPEGKKPRIVKSLPPELKIKQVGKPEHAEVHTTKDMSTKEIQTAIGKIVLTDMFDGEVAQL